MVLNFIRKGYSSCFSVIFNGAIEEPVNQSDLINFLKRTWENKIGLKNMKLKLILKTLAM